MSHSPDHHPPSTNDRTVEAYCKALEAEVERLTRAWRAMQLAKSKAEASEKEVWNERETLRAQLAAAQEQKPIAWMYEVNRAHIEFSHKEPPDDAYDEGSLTPLYVAPHTAATRD